MVGDFENEFNKGIIPRAFEYVFSYIEKEKDFKYNVSLAFIQIYLENVNKYFSLNLNSTSFNIY